jgi:hypothetical protein
VTRASSQTQGHSINLGACTFTIVDQVCRLCEVSLQLTSRPLESMPSLVLRPVSHRCDTGSQVFLSSCVQEAARALKAKLEDSWAQLGTLRAQVTELTAQLAASQRQAAPSAGEHLFWGHCVPASNTVGAATRPGACLPSMWLRQRVPQWQPSGMRTNSVS